MICLFPDPYPDELLYSVCARYNALMGYPNRVTATRDFFGDGAIAAIVDLPNRIEHLINALPPGHLYSVDEVIYRHTHYPFYAPFLPTGRALLVRNTMRDSGHNRVAERIGLSADRLKMPSRLRFCPSCVEQDRVDFGETYWHRVHQITGVEICPHHAVFLEESHTLWRNSQNPGEVFTAEQSVYNSFVKTLDTSEHTQRIQMNIARYALWLLERSGEIVVAPNLRFRYHNLLLRQGLAYYNGKVRIAQLTRHLLDYYPSEFLSRVGCDIKNPYSNWLLRLLHEHKAEVAQHPIRHILFLMLIGYPAEEVFDSFIEFKPFGDGPWPCLNRASSHHSKLHVHSCSINNGEKKNKRKPVGTFSCSCGFVYTRTGPDQLEEDRFKWTSVQSYGTEWENLLKQLWEDISLTLRQVAQRLGVNELTVKRRAISTGLAFPRPASNSQCSGGEILDRYKIRRKTYQEIQNTNREKLLLLISNNPETGRAELQALSPHLIGWLRQRDQVWLDTYFPPIKQKKPPKAIVNWEEQDLILSKAVKDAASQISLPPTPKRVSITAVIRLVGHRTWIEKRLNKLPLTSQALDTYLESFEDYSIRRIAWAAESFHKDGITPSRAMLSNRAGVRGRLISKTERVQSALDAALKL